MDLYSETIYSECSARSGLASNVIVARRGGWAGGGGGEGGGGGGGGGVQLTAALQWHLTFTREVSF